MPKFTSVAAATAAALALCAGAAQLAGAAPAKTPVAVTATPLGKALTAKNQTATITIRNTTAKRLTGLRLVVGTRKGVRVTLPGAKKGTRVRALKPLAPKRSVRVKVRLARVGKKAPKRGALTVVVRQRAKVAGRARLTFGPRAVVRPPEEPVTMTGRHFWRSQLRAGGGIDEHTLYFTGPQFVFTGDIEDAWPVCATETETCRPYTFDPKTGALTIDGVAASLEGDKLKLNDRTHWELGRAAAGARWDIVLTYANSSGICPLYCYSRTEHLQFQPDGNFVRSSVSSGTGPVDWIAVPDDSKGAYEVRADGTLRLAFADGTERIRTLGIYPADGPTPYPANPTAGVVLGSSGYFDIRD